MTLRQGMQMTAVSVKDCGLVEMVQLVDSFGPSLEEQQAAAALVVPQLERVGLLACCGQV